MHLRDDRHDLRTPIHECREDGTDRSSAPDGKHRFFLMSQQATFDRGDLQPVFNGISASF